MTRDEIMTLGFEDLETRATEIAAETAEADKDQIETLNAELDAIEERKAALNLEIEERKKAAEAVANGAGKEIEERTEKKMTDKEIRSSKEYIDAYVDYVKKNCDLNRLGAEQRALLTENAEDGTIAVPVYIENKINTSWENNEILRRIRKTTFPGNVKVGVEVSADPAVFHAEGTEGIKEEELTIEFINLIPVYIKKMVKVSHEALALSGAAFLDYLYDEIEYQLVLLAARTVVSQIVASSLAETSTGLSTNLSVEDVITAQSKLSDDANPVLITTRTQAANLRVAALGAGYAYSPFDGLDVLYTDDTSLDGNLAIVADLSGVQANFPEGVAPRFIFDEFTEADANIVRIIGRLYAAIDLVAAKKAVIITPTDENPGE